MLSLNPTADHSPTLRPQESKARPRPLEEKEQRADFQSYLAAAVQQPKPEPMREPAATKPEARPIERPIAEAQRPEATTETPAPQTAQKAGHEAPRETESIQKSTERASNENAQTRPRTTTITRSDKELLEALGLVSRKTELQATKPAPGTLRGAFEHSLGRGELKTAQKPVLVKTEAATHTLALLEKSPELILMSSDGLKKLGEKLGLSLLGKVNDKLAERNRNTESSTQAIRTESGSENSPVFTSAKQQKAGAGERDAESTSSRQQRSAQRIVSRETLNTEVPASLRQVQGDSMAMLSPANHETTTHRSQGANFHGADLRLSETVTTARTAETMRTAVENPMLRPDLVRQFNEIITRAQVLVTDTQNAQFTVKLFPREIGRMEIDLKMVDGEIRGKIVVESEEVKSEMQNFLQNHDQQPGNGELDLNKIDIEVRNGNQNAQNPERAPEADELLRNLVTQSASAVYSAAESVQQPGNALYA